MTLLLYSKRGSKETLATMTIYDKGTHFVFIFSWEFDPVLTMVFLFDHDDHQ